jgi:hypothetical protein
MRYRWTWVYGACSSLSFSGHRYYRYRGLFQNAETFCSANSVSSRDRPASDTTVYGYATCSSRRNNVLDTTVYGSLAFVILPGLFCLQNTTVAFLPLSASVVNTDKGRNYLHLSGGGPTPPVQARRTRGAQLAWRRRSCRQSWKGCRTQRASVARP